MKDRARRFISDFSTIYGIASTVVHGTPGFLPLPEDRPPSFVIVPSRKKPHIKIMRGQDYLSKKRKGLL